MPDNLFKARNRAQRFWYLDGLSEIFLGIVFLLQTGWLLVMSPSYTKSLWHVPVIVMYVLLLAAFSMRAPRTMAAMRERITYPRSGYAKPDESVRRRRLGIVGLTILAVFTGALATRNAGVVAWDPARWVQWMPAVGGLTVGVVSVYVSMRYGLLRYLFVGLLSIVLGVVVSIEYPMRLASVIWLAGVGCAWMCSGGVTLWNYVRVARPSADGK